MPMGGGEFVRNGNFKKCNLASKGGIDMTSMARKAKFTGINFTVDVFVIIPAPLGLKATES